MEKFFVVLLIIFVPLSFTLYAAHSSPALIFFFSAFAMVPLARYIGKATESLATRTNAALGGLMNVTFGNATELIIGVFAIRAGLIDIVKASLTGSIIGNLLLVLGTALAAGGVRYKKQEFNRTAALASGTTLFLAVVALIMPAVLPAASVETNSMTIELVSILVAVGMFTMYAFTLIFSLYTHKHLYAAEEAAIPEDMDGTWGTTKSMYILFLATVGVALLSNMFVGAIEPVARSFGWTQSFIGVVVVAMIGNAAEHVSAIVMAVKNKVSLAIQIAVGSATQVAMFVAPVLVFLSLLFPIQMNLIFTPFELASIILSVVIVNMVLADGESNWLEGAQLVIAYIVMAIAFFVHP
jgi:Ca2+:H+ antiporter